MKKSGSHNAKHTSSGFGERCASGISGFDDLCQGGFVRNSLNTIIGGPGAGKTLFLLQFLYNGATKYNENGIYLSFEPDLVDIFKDSFMMGWDFQKLDAQGKVKFIRLSPMSGVNEVKSELTRAISKYKIKRICLDPISLFQAVEQNEAKVRMNIFDMGNFLKKLNVTVLLADEMPSTDTDNITAGPVTANSRTEFTKFLADGLVNMFSSGLGGISDRAIRVSKMRRTKHVRGPVPMEITDEGLVVKGKSK